MKTNLLAAVAGFAVVLLAASAGATWSILILDTRTGEIALGSATCLTSFDLRATTPVLRVGVGAATCQSAIDSGAVNRMRIWQEFQAGTPLPQILSLLAMLDPSHQSRQYGMVEMPDQSLTFTGAAAGAWAGGVTGQVGTLVYAVQGNVLTGLPVVTMAEQAILNTPGDLPAKLMAAMEAARAMGGDGRCSCSPGSPTGCGAPPVAFIKSAHIAYMIDARLGDIDGVCSAAPGCASGTYYLNLNVAFQPAGALDPVLQMATQFATWRTSWIGRPDHYLSTVMLDEAWLPADGAATTTATMVVRDWQGTLLGSGLAIGVTLDPASTASASFELVTDLGGGSYSFPVTAGASAGDVLLRITVNDGAGAVRLSPSTRLELLPCACSDCDISGAGAEILDAFAAARIAVRLASPSAAQLRCCDVNASLSINAIDALLMAQASVGIPVGLGCP